MARPEVANGDGLQIQGIAADILNKQLHTANKGWSYSFKNLFFRNKRQNLVLETKE
jgi:hypothetical protein